MAYPSFRAGAAATKYAADQNLTLTKPSGAAENDILQAVLATNDSTRTVTSVPTGWVLTANIGESISPGGRMWVYKKKAGASEPADYTWVFNWPFNGMTAIWATQDCDDVSIYGTEVSGVLTTPYSVATPSIAVPDDSSLVVWIGGLRTIDHTADTVPTAPSGFTLRIDGGAAYEYASIAVADKQQATAGASGTATGSIARSGGGNGRGFGVLLAISPTGGATTITASGEAECPVVKSVALSSVSEHIPVGNYTDVPATVRDQSGTGLQYLTGTATSSDTDIATVSQLAATDDSGGATLRITGVAPGSTTVTLTVDGVVSNSVAVTINQAASTTALITPPSVDLGAGATQTFAATLSGQAADFVWTVESGGGSITSAGVYTAPSTATTAVVRAALSTDGNIYAEATVTVTVQAAEAGVVQTTWRRTRSGRAEPLAGYELDYWIISSADTLIASGTGTTDSSGTLTLRVSSAYSGQDVLVVVNNLDADMSTVGKIKGQQVVTVG